MSASLSSLTDMHINYYIATSFWPVSNTAEIGTWRSVKLFRSGLWGDCSTQAATVAQITVWDMVDSCEEILSPSRKERLISHKTTGMLGGRWLPASLMKRFLQLINRLSFVLSCMYQAARYSMFLTGITALICHFQRRSHTLLPLRT
jgi:hypothetical protein